MLSIQNHAGVLLVASILGLVHSQAADAPNLLVIMTDEQNLRTIGAYRKLMGDKQAFPWGPKNFVDTPNLDRLASEGKFCPSHKLVFPRCDSFAYIRLHTPNYQEHFSTTSIAQLHFAHPQEHHS